MTILGLLFLLVFVLAFVFQSPVIMNILFLAGASLAFWLLYEFRMHGSRPSFTEETKSVERKEAVRILSAIFAVFIGLSLTTAVGNVFKDPWLLFTDPLSPTIVLFAVFLITVVPFIQGSLILFARYAMKINGADQTKDRDPFIDAAVIFVQAGIYLGMAATITILQLFIFWTFSLQLVSGIYLVHLRCRSGAKAVGPLREWLGLDIVFGTYLTLCYFFILPLQWSFTPLFLAAAAFARTLTDYRVAYKWYF